LHHSKITADFYRSTKQKQSEKEKKKKKECKVHLRFIRAVFLTVKVCWRL